MVDTRDVLYKAAEDVTQGMHCKGQFFDDGVSSYLDIQVLRGQTSVETAIKARRCAHGSLALATVLLGGSEDDYDAAVAAVCWRVPDPYSLVEFNDEHLPDDPFEAGQVLAELFRQTADSL